MGSELQAGSASTGGASRAVDVASQQLSDHAGAASGAAGHADVTGGLEDLVTFHGGILQVLTVALDALSSEIRGFDTCMTQTDAQLAGGS